MTQIQRQSWQHMGAGVKLSALALLSMSTGCIVPSSEPFQRTSLFGNRSGPPTRGVPPQTTKRNEPMPPIATGRRLQELENVAPSGALLPQINSSLSGNSGHGGFSRPMMTSPLMFQRLDKNTWRIAASAPLVFQTVARILSQTYILSQTDRRSFSLSTEWDKFFIDGRLFRNRVSINVFPLNSKFADLVIKNSIEYYTQNNAKLDTNSPDQWLPTQDITNEMDRILEKTQKQLMAGFTDRPTLRK